MKQEINIEEQLIINLKQEFNTKNIYRIEVEGNIFYFRDATKQDYSYYIFLQSNKDDATAALGFLRSIIVKGDFNKIENDSDIFIALLPFIREITNIKQFIIKNIEGGYQINIFDENDEDNILFTCKLRKIKATEISMFEKIQDPNNLVLSSLELFKQLWLEGDISILENNDNIYMSMLPVIKQLINTKIANYSKL